MNIEVGDYVRHKTFIHLNGGVAFNVIDIQDDKALCEFFNSKSENQEEWFAITDLILVNKHKGGFRNAGEEF